MGVAIDEASLQSFLGFALAAAIGIAFYSTEFPERFWPGKFDLFFHSHQIFHVWAVIGGLIHLDAIRKLQIFRLNFNHSNQTSVNIWENFNKKETSLKKPKLIMQLLVLPIRISIHCRKKIKFVIYCARFFGLYYRVRCISF